VVKKHAVLLGSVPDRILPKTWKTVIVAKHVRGVMGGCKDKISARGDAWTFHQCNMHHASIRCQAKFLTCEISDFTPCAHAQSNIIHIKHAEKTDD